MHQRRAETIDGTASTEPRAEWIRTEVDRLIVGGAEAAGGGDVDGADLQS